MAKSIATDRNIIDTLADIFQRSEARSYQGQGVSMSEHMLQTAAGAERAQASPQLVVAALLHDVGHFGTDFRDIVIDPKHATMLNATVDLRHEEAGTRLLEPFFGPEVTEPIRLHVQAKCYLCAVEPDYFDKLSPQAVHTLSLQNGSMSLDEVAAFEADPHSHAATNLRRWDDEAVVPGLETPNFESYRRLIGSLLKG